MRQVGLPRPALEMHVYTSCCQIKNIPACTAKCQGGKASPRLQVPENADADALKKAKRKKVLLTHPDKLGEVVGTNEAFARVTEVNTPGFAQGLLPTHVQRC
jgi:hypothetical protein